MRKTIGFVGLLVAAGFGFGYSQGFTVSGTQLKDANGGVFIQKGFAIPLAWFVSDVNANIANIKKNTNANCLRIVMQESTTDANWQSCVSQCIANKIIPEVEIHDVTCGTDANALNNVAKWWVTKASYLTQASIAKYILINIANEWGDWAMAKNNPSAWSAAFKTAVATMRAGGINTTLIIDAPDCGQDLNNGSTLKSYAMDVFNSDPKKNCLFTLHLYGEWCSGGSQPTVGLPAVKNAGIPIIVGEFAAQSSAGTLNAASVISTCETNKMGWMAWSWKGNGEVELDMSSDWAGTNLTSWGKTAVTGTYGTKTAVTCSVFTGIVDTKKTNAPTSALTNYMTLKTGEGGRVSVGLSGISGAAIIEVVDAKGKLVRKQATGCRSFADVDMRGKTGVYLVKAITERGEMSRTLLVQ